MIWCILIQFLAYNFFLEFLDIDFVWEMQFHSHGNTNMSTRHIWLLTNALCFFLLLLVVICQVLQFLIITTSHRVFLDILQNNLFCNLIKFFSGVLWHWFGVGNAASMVNKISCNPELTGAAETTTTNQKLSSDTMIEVNTGEISFPF